MKITLGWDGKCASHRTMDTIARRTPHAVTLMNHDRGRESLVGLIQIHCAAGHQYYAVDIDEMIDDPFSAEEELAITSRGEDQ